MSTRAKLIIALVVVLGVIGTLIRTAVTSAATYYVTVGELYQQGQQALNANATVNGNIIGSSVLWNPSASLLQFSMEDTKGARQLPVVFHGDKPDDFANDWPVIVSGTLQADGTFKAEKLLIKCPSKYNAKDQTTTFTAK